MAWIYFRELVGLVSLSEIGSDQSPIVKLKDTAKVSYCPECNQVSLTLPPSGMTCELSEKNCSQKSTLFMGDSPAKTSVLLEMEKAWKESEVVFSMKSSDLQKNVPRPSSFSKTSLPYALKDYEKYSEHLPISGMTVDGLVYQPKSLVPHTLEKDGSYLPTPTAKDVSRTYQYKPGTKKKVYMLAGMAKENRWPTPTARDWKEGQNPFPHGKYSPSMAVMVHSLGYKGYLNPQFVEMMMGYLIDHTVLNPLVMQWFQSKPKKHLKD